MKCLLILTLTLSFNAFATPPWLEDNDYSQNQNQEQQQAQGQTSINKNSNVNRNSSYSKSGAVAGAISSGKNSNDISIVDNEVENASASAASVITAACQVGVSGQTRDGGFAITNTDQFCDYLKLAAVHLNAYNVHLEMANKCFQSNETKNFLCHANERAEKSYERYSYFIDKADSLLTKTSGTAVLERGASQLLKPLGLIGLLVFLI